MAVKFKLEGIPKLQKDLEKLGKVPQKHVTTSAKKGMNIAHKQAKADAPYDTGALKKGILMKGERSKIKGKKVYRIVFDRAMNHYSKSQTKMGKIHRLITQSVRNTVSLPGTASIFPVSGFITNSLNDNARSIEKTIVSEMQKES